MRYDIDFNERPELHEAFPNPCLEGWVANTIRDPADPAYDNGHRLICPDSSAKAVDALPAAPAVPHATWNEEAHWARDSIVDTGAARQRLLYLPNDTYDVTPTFPADWTD